MNRYFIYLGYNGKHFCGWQVQPNGITVQQCIEEALATLLRQPVPIVGAGRTDAGVHARQMVAHFDWHEPVADPVFLAEKLNRLLPKDIAVYRIVPVTPDAHARFDATSRTYTYYITNRKDPFNHEWVYRIPSQLDFEAMNNACRVLFDYIDFTSFSKLHTDVKTNNCHIHHAGWKQEGDIWVFTIQADRFLRNMVRAIVGTLLEVGRGKLTVEGFRRVIEAKDRGMAGSSAPGHALYLVDVAYPDQLFIKMNRMKITINPDRKEMLIGALIALWETSVRATHHFLTEDDMTKLVPFVRIGLSDIETLVVAEENQKPIAFMGIDAEKIEMLFVSPDCFGKGIGRELAELAVSQYSVQYVDVNEQNPRAAGFYRHIGFEVFERTELDEQGNPFPILKMKHINQE